MNQRRVTIVGGGVASLLLGISLCERAPDACVELVSADRAPMIGGHLVSWEEGGLPIEHGFHTLGGFYDAVLPTLRRLGIMGNFTRGPDRVNVFENGAVHRLSSASLLRFGGHSVRQKLALAKGLPGLWRVLREAVGAGLDGLDRFDGMDFRELGRELGIGRAMLESNFVQMFYDFGFNGPEPMSAAVGLKVLVKLLENPTLYHFNLPSRQALVEPLYERFQRYAGARVELGTRLARVHFDAAGRSAVAIEVERGDGTRELRRVDQLVLALDLEGFRKVELVGAAGDCELVQKVRRLRTVSSLSMQAWFPEDPVPGHIDNVIGGLPEPLSVVCPVTRVRRGADPHGYELIAVGPEQGFEDVEDGVLVERLFTTLRRVGFRIPEDRRGVRVHMHRNRAPGQRYLLTRPGDLALRPTPVTPFENLFLAGAWLRNSFSLPSVQGAAQSSEVVAQAISARFASDAAPISLDARRVRIAATNGASAPRAASAVSDSSAERPLGMPRSSPLCPPAPYRHAGADACFFIVGVNRGRIERELPSCLELAPGFASRALVTVVDYRDVYSVDDPTGAVFRFKEVVIAAVVRDARRASPGGYGLFPLFIYIDDDVAVAVGREVYGFPKKLADVRIGEGSVVVSRNGRRPGSGRGHVHPIELLRGSWRARQMRAGATPGLLGGAGLDLAQGAAWALNELAGVPFYLNQVIPSPPGIGGGRAVVSRVLRVPITDLEISSTSRIDDARLELGDSTLDPLLALTPDRAGELPVLAAARFEMAFNVDRAELVADESARSSPPREVALHTPVREEEVLAESA